MSDVTKQFPVLLSGRIEDKGKASIPWHIIEPHREQARRNHGQTLERLAERGGLSWSELAAVLADRDWSAMQEGLARRFVLDVAGLLPPDDFEQ